MERPADVIIWGDHNQDVASKVVQIFFAELKVQDMCQTFNTLDVKGLDHTHIRLTKCVDSSATTPSIRKHSEGSRVLEKMI